MSLLSHHPELADRLRERKVIPFVGAGVSRAVDGASGGPAFPSWKELLLEAAREAEPRHAELIRAFLDLPAPRYHDAAGEARRQLGDLRWYAFLRRRLGLGRDGVDPATLELARLVWALGSRLVVTTNCDHVLRWSCPSSDPAVWRIESAFNQGRALYDGVHDYTLWYLHGDIAEPEQVIFTLDDYRLLYPGPAVEKSGYPAALKTLHTYLLTHTFVFVGFSMDDVYVAGQLREIDESFSNLGGPHYVIARPDERARIESRAASLRVIEIEDFGPPLLALLREMAGAAEGGAPAADRRGEAGAPVPERAAGYDPAHPVFSVPYPPKGAQMVGRDDDVLAIRAQLTGGPRTALGRTAALQGFGGVGKTQLAVEYAYRYRREYPSGVIWINADQSIGSQLLRLGEEARWVAPEADQVFRLEVARRRLRTCPGCLIVLDNVRSVDDIQPYLPDPLLESHLLVTSRTEQEGFVPIRLRTLDPEQALGMLVREAGREPEGEAEREEARLIAQRLGGLPLALELAGAYLRARPIAWRKYRKLLEHNLRSALPRRLLSFTRHEADLYGTLKVDEAVFRDEPRLRGIMDLLVCSAPSPMGQPLLAALLGVDDPTALAGPLALGVALGLLKPSRDGELYEVHALVAKVRREGMRLERRGRWLEGGARRIGDWFEGQLDAFANPRLFEGEADHLAAWRENAERWVPGEACRLTWLLHYPFYHRGRYPEARTWLDRALERCGRPGTDPQLKASVLVGLANVDFQMNRLGEALRHAEAALAIREEVLGADDPATASALSDVSVILRGLRDNPRALEFGKRALGIRLRRLGKADPGTAESANNLALVYRAMDENERALRYARRALAIYRRSLGREHPYTATAYGNVGATLHNLKRYEEAWRYAARSLRIRLRVLGGLHPSTATSYHNAGASLRQLGRLEEARRHLRRAARIRVQLLGFAHTNTCLTIQILADVLAALGRRDEALGALDRLLSRIGPRHRMWERLEAQRREIAGE